MIIGHRGIPELITENTLASFSSAVIEHNADGFETDLRLSADGKLYCFHDADFERLISTGQWQRLLGERSEKPSVESMNSAELNEIIIANSGQSHTENANRYSNAIPTIKELLELYAELCKSSANPNLILYLEIKKRKDYSRMFQLLESALKNNFTSGQLGNIWLQSFDPAALAEMHSYETLQACPKSLLMSKSLEYIIDGSAFEQFIEEQLRTNKFQNLHISKTMLYLLNEIRSIDVVDICHNRNMALHVYTFNSGRYKSDYTSNAILNPHFGGFKSFSEELYFFADLGIDALLCDHAGKARSSLNLNKHAGTP